MVNIKKIKPLYNTIITTMDRYVDPQFIAGTSIIDPSKSKQGIKEYQKVVAIGSFIKDIHIGDIVCINPRNYEKKKYSSNSIKDGVENMNEVISYAFNVVHMDGNDYLMITDRDIDFIVEEWDEIPD